MARLLSLVAALSVSCLLGLGLQVAPAHAATPSVKQALLVGELGIEGGAYPGLFHPTAGTVEVEFANPPLVLLKKVGRSGQFRIALGPGTYTVIGCGPSGSAGISGRQCSRPQTVTLAPGEVDYLMLIWAYVP